MQTVKGSSELGVRLPWVARLHPCMQTRSQEIYRAPRRRRICPFLKSDFLAICSFTPALAVNIVYAQDALCCQAALLAHLKQVSSELKDCGSPYYPFL